MAAKTGIPYVSTENVFVGCWSPSRLWGSSDFLVV